MVYFYTKNPNLSIFWRALVFGTLNQKKSGTPGRDLLGDRFCICQKFVYPKNTGSLEKLVMYVRVLSDRVARVFLIQYTKTIKMTQTTTNFREYPLTITNNVYIRYKRTIRYKCLTFSNPRPSKMYPNWDFLYANIPSGNPGLSSL
jgi:hypothetical protein